MIFSIAVEFNWRYFGTFLHNYFWLQKYLHTFELYGCNKNWQFAHRFQNILESLVYIPISAGPNPVNSSFHTRVATKILRRFWGRAADTGSMIL